MKKTKQKITQLAYKHLQTDELWEAEIFESEALALIYNFCLSNKYDINGFPFKLINNGIDVDDYFEELDILSFQGYLYYIEKLSIVKKDVAELLWHFVSAFWPDQFENEVDYYNDIYSRLKANNEIEL